MSKFFESDVAEIIAKIRRGIKKNQNMSLAELIAEMQTPGVVEHLPQITIDDILKPDPVDPKSKKGKRVTPDKDLVVQIVDMIHQVVGTNKLSAKQISEALVAEMRAKEGEADKHPEFNGIFEGGQFKSYWTKCYKLAQEGMVITGEKKNAKWALKTAGIEQEGQGERTHRKR